MPFYDGDFLRDTAHLSADEGWAYLHLIMYYWANGSLPTEPERLARIAKMSLKRWRNRASTLATFFDNDWKHKRIEKEIDKYDKFIEKQRTNRTSGWTKLKPNCESGPFSRTTRAPVPEPEPYKEKDLVEKEKVHPNGEANVKRPLPLAPQWHQNQTRFLGSNGILWIDGKPYSPR